MALFADVLLLHYYDTQMLSYFLSLYSRLRSICSALERPWRFLLAFGAIYATWVSMLEFGFQFRGLLIFNLIFDVLFILDIIINIMHGPNIKYKWAWIILDTCTIVPFILFFCTAHGHRYYALLRIIRLRLPWDMILRLQENKKLNHIVVRMLILLYISTTSVHYGACLIIFLASKCSSAAEFKERWGQDLDYKQGSVVQLYIRALYWSITTATITGYGDVTAASKMEMIFCIIYMLYCLWLNAYILHSAGKLIIVNKEDKQLRETLEAVDDFVARTRLVDSIQEQMREYIRLKYHRVHEILLPHQIPDELPKYIRVAIVQHLFVPLCPRIYLFRGVSEAFLSELVTQMELVQFFSEEVIILRDDIHSSLYLRASGSVKLGSGEQMAQLPQNYIIGEISACCDEAAEFTICAEGFCQLLKVDRNNFLRIIQRHAEDRAVIFSNLLEHLFSKNLHLMPICEEISRIVYHDTIVPLPGAVRNNGRTSLHVAAIHGNSLLVDYLVRNGADCGVKDSGGLTALVHATRARDRAPVPQKEAFDRIINSLSFPP